MATPLSRSHGSHSSIADHSDDDDGACISCKCVQTVASVALQTLALIGLALWQAPCFLLGFSVGFIVKCVAKKACSRAIHEIQAVIAKRPWLFAGVVVAATIAAPEWLLIGPSLIGGFYGGMQFARLCQKS